MLNTIRDFFSGGITGGRPMAHLPDSGADHALITGLPESLKRDTDATTEWTTPHGQTITTSPVNLLNTIPPTPNLADDTGPDDLSPMERHLSELLTAA